MGGCTDGWEEAWNHAPSLPSAPSPLLPLPPPARTPLAAPTPHWPRCSSLLRTAFLLLLLISATWLLGLLAVNSDVLAFHYLFAIFSCLQVGSCGIHLGGFCLDQPW